MFNKPVKDKRLITVKTMPLFPIGKVEEFTSNNAGTVMVIWGNPSEEIILQKVKQWEQKLSR